MENNKTRYAIRSVEKKDYQRIVSLYNSNPGFLIHHLDYEQVDLSFVSREIEEMKKIQFFSCVIVDLEKDMIHGIVDYKLDKEVYLSIFLLDQKLQGKGIGSEIYNVFEDQMKREGAASIRIDVVNDYVGHVVPFWKKHGFEECEEASINWGNKTSQIIVMRKKLFFPKVR